MVSIVFKSKFALRCLEYFHNDGFIRSHCLALYICVCFLYDPLMMVPFIKIVDPIILLAIFRVFLSIVLECCRYIFNKHSLNVSEIVCIQIQDTAANAKYNIRTTRARLEEKKQVLLFFWMLFFYYCKYLGYLKRAKSNWLENCSKAVVIP